MDSTDALELRLGYRFTDRRLLQRALTHRSATEQHNERLEFLGDAVLATVISTLLYRAFAEADEGDLSRIRANLVREESLHRAALAIELPPLLRLSEGEWRSGGTQRASILADALEAIVGAVYLDGGYEAAHALVTRLFGDAINHADAQSWGKDAKTELQEWLQGRKLAVPVYRIVATAGQAHTQTFDVECAVQSLGLTGRGVGRSRRAAEQEAARALLTELKTNQTAASGS